MKMLVILFLFFFFNLANASTKTEIIKKFSKIENLSFNFTQTIGGKDEKGNCVISFPKKIYCKYDLRSKKILVSNGTSLVIKNKNKQYYRYPLQSTPLSLLLDKSFIIKNINLSKKKLLNDKYYVFSMKKDDKTLNIFFEKKKYDLIGWQTEDIYQNLSVTYIYNLKVNSNIDKAFFKLPLAEN